ncbi:MULTISPECIES: FAD-dependent oxidoreductase [Kordiimonas]|uniref:FAD-dependent oxidoreductase n=1 Tax=Kordiimonas TaxID=288021 RepID=UPI002FDA1A48
MEQVDSTVIGARMVGIAAARQLAEQGRELILLDAEATFGAQTFSRNSEVIQAGVYYPKNFLKAFYCIRISQAL